MEGIWPYFHQYSLDKIILNISDQSDTQQMSKLVTSETVTLNYLVLVLGFLFIERL